MMYDVVFYVIIIAVFLPFFYPIYKQYKLKKEYAENKLRFEQEMYEKEALKQQRIQEIKDKEKMELIEFRKSIFPIISDDESVQNIWGKWDCELHDTHSQIRNQLNALYNVLPVLVFKSVPNAFYYDSLLSKIIVTSLTECSCEDFKKEGIPCRHMYSLFLVLNKLIPVSEGLFDTNNTNVEKFLKLTPEQQHVFIKEVVFLHLLKGKHNIYLTAEIKALIDVGLFEYNYDVDYEPILNKETKDNIILALAKKGIQGYRPSWTKVKLVAWVQDNHKEFLVNRYKNDVCLTASDDVLSWGKTIYYALHNEHLFSQKPYSVSEALLYCNKTPAAD